MLAISLMTISLVRSVVTHRTQLQQLFPLLIISLYLCLAIEEFQRTCFFLVHFLEFFSFAAVEIESNRLRSFRIEQGVRALLDTFRIEQGVRALLDAFRIEQGARALLDTFGIEQGVRALLDTFRIEQGVRALLDAFRIEQGARALLDTFGIEQGVRALLDTFRIEQGAIKQTIKLCLIV